MANTRAKKPANKSAENNPSESRPGRNRIQGNQGQGRSKAESMPDPVQADLANNAAVCPADNPSDNTVVPAVRKRGRPKGSTDKTTRKPRADHDIQSAGVIDGKNANTTRFAMALNKLPKIDINNPVQVENRINDYYAICAAHNLKPTVAMLAFSFGVTRITLFNWLNGKNDVLQNRESINAIKNAYNLIGGLYETYLNDGSMIPVSAFFLMKNNYGYKDVTSNHIISNIFITIIVLHQEESGYRYHAAIIEICFI